MKVLISPILFLLAFSAMAQSGTNTIKAGAKLTEGQRLISANKSYYLTIQADGNMCIYTSTNTFVWCSMANKGKGSYLTMQADGNLVVSDSKNQSVWDTKTQAYFDAKYATAEWKPVRTVLENDGTLCLYNASNKKVWNNTAANTAQPDTKTTEGFSGSVTKKQVKIALPFSKTTSNVEVEITSDGQVIYQSDMNLGTVQSLQDPQAHAENSRRWQNSVIPYVLPNNHNRREVILKGINEMNAKTNICLVPRTNEKDYVEFVSKDGNWSSLGKVGGRQEISIQNQTVGTVCHEIMHALGFFHTQSREDRGRYVGINLGNVEGGKEHNFQKESDKASNLGTYDFASVMHYPAKAFAKNISINTINLKNAKGGEDKIMGQRDGMSPGDITNIAIIYPKGPCKPGYVATKPATATPVKTATTTTTTPTRVTPTTPTTTVRTREAKPIEPMVDGKKVVPIPAYKAGTEKFINLVYDEAGVGNQNVKAYWVRGTQDAGNPTQAIDGHITNDWSEEPQTCHSGEDLTPGWNVNLGQITYVEYIEIWNSADPSSLNGRNFYVAAGQDLISYRLIPEPAANVNYTPGSGILIDGSTKNEPLGPYKWETGKTSFIIPIKKNVKTLTIMLYKDGVNKTPLTMEEVVIYGKKLESRRRTVITTGGQ